MADVGGSGMLGQITGVVGLLATFVGAGWAVFQYSQNSKDQQAERARIKAVTAAGEMEQFHKDEAVLSAMRLIDYCEMSDNLPAGASPMLVHPAEFVDALRNHAEKISTLSANPNIEKSELFTPNQRKIRDVIDGYLGRLERIDNLIARGVIDKGDFERLYSYWLQLTGEIPQERDSLNHLDDERRQALWNYIRTYRFDGVIRLYGRYGRAAGIGIDPDNAFSPRRR